MNRIKRIGLSLLTIVLVLTAVLQLDIGKAFAENAQQAGEYITSLFTSEKAESEPNKYIYFDLAAGNVNITNTTYTGFVYVGGNAQEVSGQHVKTNKYYVYQSNGTNKSETGYAKQTDYDDKINCRIPEYTRVKNGNEQWTKYITNNTDVKDVSRKWESAAADSGRTSTTNYINFAQASEYTADVTIDNIWSSYHHASVNRTTGGIGAHLDNMKNTTISLHLKGDNRVGCVHYSSDQYSGNQIIFSNDDDNSNPGSITVADFPTNFKANHWNSVIGAADNPANTGDMSEGIVINSGIIFAGSTPEDNCTAIGGGGNNYGGVTINGGTVTAVVSSTGTAIGGGIGYGAKGGNTDVIINDGTIYAYNLGIKKGEGDNFEKFVPAAAIGGGGSKNAAGSLTANITINGGTIYAQSMGGPGIGGGCSANSTGGPATINITGGTIIAKSTEGTYGTQVIDAAVSIGGGTGYTAGGSVTLNISGEDTILRTGSIGGGLANQEGAKIGNATVKVSGGNIIGQIIMEGGAANPCSFTMTGGVIHSTDVINGITIGKTNITGVTVTDPQPDVPLSFISKDGGAVFMNDNQGVAVITGGLIGNCTANNGGAVYMAGGKFTLSGTGQLGTNHAKESGGSVYVGGGSVQMGGEVKLKDGTVLVAEGSEDVSKCAIRNSDAAVDGGGVYVVGTPGQDGAVVTMYGGEIHSNTAGHDGGGMYIDQGKVDFFDGSLHDNKAVENGGGIYVAGDVHMLGGNVSMNRANSGGGFCVEEGKVIMYGGSINDNSATENGGGMHILATNITAAVDIFSGSISRNTAKMGGGVSVISESDKPIYVTVGVNCQHTDLDTETREFTEFDYPTDSAECGKGHAGHTHYHIGDEVKKHSSCPEVKNNIATENGGGFFLSSSQTQLDFYCIIEGGNIAHGKKQCYNMDVKGGHVIIGDDTHAAGSEDPVKGNIVMQSSIFVEGGTVDIYGKMNNPEFTDDVTVDIKNDTDHYIDHRITYNPNLTYYKVHYYENFKGEGDTPTGLYIARQYPDLDHDASMGDEKYDFTIMSSIFSHPGYKIVGWNTKPDDTGDKYNVNETYNLKELDEEGKVSATNSDSEFDNSLLVIYAIWERSGYVLKFDPNVSEGETYTGTMENQRVTVGLLDGSQTISKNQFKRPGCKFTGWTLTPKPTADDRVYADCEPIKEDFTMEDGDSVTLYANWEICDHVDYLTYSVNENTLTESCSNCGKHSAAATVSAVNCVYDGNEHPATVNISSNWLGKQPVLTYDMAASEWDSKDEIDENWTPDSVPLHAGDYTASLTVQEDITAQTKYTISPIRWATPDVPEVDFKVENDNSVIQITSPKDYNIEYWIQALDADNNKSTLDTYPNWVKDSEFTDIPFGNYYYFYAKRTADRDHLESLPSQSEAYLATGGNIVYIENDTGIKVVPKFGGGKFEYTVSADDGYHLRNYNDNSDVAAQQAIPIPGASDKAYNHGGITVTKSPSPADGTYTYGVVFDKVAYHQVTLKFRGAVKNASVTHKVTDGQVFRDFNSKDTNISCDSAFTTQFTLNNYIPDEYKAQELNFSTALPIGTTIIMKVNGGYWYYNLDTEKSAINLTEFISMGEEGKNYSLNTADNTKAATITYQFIVDFSQTANITTDTGSLGVSLKLIANSSTAAPIVPTVESSIISLGIKDAAAFKLDLADITGKTASLKGTYTPSEGDASIWNSRRTALVLTASASSTVPADLRLTAVADGSTTLYKMTANRQFIIPLGDINNEDVKITLSSGTFNSSEKNLEFTANWYVSQSNADTSPLNGYKAASCNVSFSCEKDSIPSVRIDGTQHLCKKGGKLEITVNYKGIPNHENIIAYLYSKNGNQYVYTGASVPVENETINYEQHNKQVTFNMGDMGSGSYRILVVVQESGANILQVPYYFVIA